MLKDLVCNNRSIRRFDATHPVTKDELYSLVNLARLSPSAANRQPLKYVIAYEKEDLDKIFPCIGWAAYLQDWKGPEPKQRPTAYIVMITEMQIAPHVNIDPGIAAQTIMLGATELGLGGCMIASINKNKIRRILKIPNYYEVLLTIALGKPDEKVIVDEIDKDGDIRYWRDDNDVHHVPKRKLEDIIIDFKNQ
ncbi:MAG: nitroreductase family protein [Candidatus Cloacimonadales bacterium]|jgi:nitroreductase|nr:nitroreductase family protein [Candidatus Cloacimonadota bacterium]MDD2651151.1 nitroreductase family protein [Candidatus Cloacimonadota bacterium]MDD3501185.1 nitroreductase family protein [Candidatus Cloacimonadota bacterium]MDX9976882.1 nitroreductase family protein [Candidatus Cloacimonadales bacterium]